MTDARPKAYSYIRFSTPDQIRGDSLRRQTRMAEEYATRHGLDLDTSLNFQDLGVSAHRGGNIKGDSALTKFSEAVDAGLVKEGSYLLIENLDRYSRGVALRAANRLLDICEKGITVVTLNDNQEFTADSLQTDSTAILLSVLGFIRAHDESAIKGRRLRAAWESKRATGSTKPLTAVCPAWLRLDKATGKFVAIPERANVVRKMFYETLQGCSPHSIALALNVECVPKFGRGTLWHRSYVIKILANSAVTGTMTPHTTEYPDGKLVRRPMAALSGYYPAIVDDKTFQRVQSLRLGTTAPMRGKHAGKEVTNIFGGLGKCARCGGTMTRINKSGKRNITKGGKRKLWHYLVCSAAKVGAGCLYQNIPYDQVETAFIESAPYLIAHVPSGDKGKALDKEIRSNETALDVVTEKLGRLVRELERGPSAVVRQRFRELEDTRDELNTTLSGLAERHAETSGPLVRNKLADLREAAIAKPLNRTLLNSVLRQTLSSVEVDPDNGLLVFHWKHGGESELVYGWPKDAKRA